MKNYFSDLEPMLDEMVEYLKKNPTVLSHENRDGRVNSITNEDEIIDNLKKNPKFNENMYVPEARHWFDFSIVNNRIGMPVNIKVSDLSNSAADNLSSKQGMAFALTGNAQVSNSWPKFNKELIDEIKSGYDYYYLVVNKNNPSDCYWTSLKRIRKLTANGNNLPFQCDWGANRAWATRTDAEATKYILGVYQSSWDKKISGYPKELEKVLEREDIFSK